jgi:hypothetical protein
MITDKDMNDERKEKLLDFLEGIHETIGEHLSE